MMSVLCSHKQMDVMFSKGAPESIIARCTKLLCNSDRSVVPLTAASRAELESRFARLGIKFNENSFNFIFTSLWSSFDACIVTSNGNFALKDMKDVCSIF